MTVDQRLRNSHEQLCAEINQLWWCSNHQKGVLMFPLKWFTITTQTHNIWQSLLGPRLWLCWNFRGPSKVGGVRRHHNVGIYTFSDEVDHDKIIDWFLFGNRSYRGWTWSVTSNMLLLTIITLIHHCSVCKDNTHHTSTFLFRLLPLTTTSLPTLSCGTEADFLGLE